MAALTASLLAVGFTWWFQPEALGIVLLIVQGRLDASCKSSAHVSWWRRSRSSARCASRG